jgi:hypothetical protein
MQAMWESMRGAVIKNVPESAGTSETGEPICAFVDEIYQSDAYHSLSIEGYSVTPALIERVQQGDWDPDHHEDDRQSRDALAARGYWQAFQKVKDTVGEVIAGRQRRRLARAAHKEWYRELFQPCVAGGPDRSRALAGYRNDPGLSAHVALCAAALGGGARGHAGALRSARKETRAVCPRRARHWLFGYVHPYPDGNGRMARFLMNAMLASGGYPWTVIRVEGSQRLSGGAGSRQHRHENRALRGIHRGIGSGGEPKLHPKLLIDERTYCYARPLHSQCAGHCQKCDADVFRNQLKSFVGRQHILIVLVNHPLLCSAPTNHVVQYWVDLAIKNNPGAVPQVFQGKDVFGR